MIVAIPSRITFTGIPLYKEEWGTPFREVTTTYCVYPPQGNTPSRRYQQWFFTSIPFTKESYCGTAS
jgi:hypothetical protein